MNELAIMTLAPLQCKRKNDNNPYWAKKRVEFHDEGDLCQNKFLISAGVNNVWLPLFGTKCLCFCDQKKSFFSFLDTREPNRISHILH